jgi:hypothetical protein
MSSHRLEVMSYVRRLGEKMDILTTSNLTLITLVLEILNQNSECIDLCALWLLSSFSLKISTVTPDVFSRLCS